MHVYSLLGLLILIFTIWMLVDCIQNRRLNDTERIIWVLVILFLPTLGAIIYCVVGRQR